MPTRTLTLDHLPTFIQAVRDSERIAVDTEFHAERRYVPRLFLVQVLVANGDAWIIDPLVDTLLARCAEALKSVPWLVHGGSQDIRLLHRSLGGLPPFVIDTQIGAALVRERFPEGYGALVATFLGTVLPKAATLSDWSKRPLSHEQVEYAADDVIRLPALWDSIEVELRRLGRLELAHHACAEAAASAVLEPEPQEAWRAFAAAKGLSPRARSILRELCGWRENIAQDKNQPPRSIIGDGSILELAKRPPASSGTILQNRRFPRSAAKHVDALWACVQRGQKTLSSDAPATLERFSAPWRGSYALAAWALELGHRDTWSPRLVLDAPLIESLLLTPAKDRTELADRLGWRDVLIGDALWGAISGEQRFTLAHGALTQATT